MKGGDLVDIRYNRKFKKGYNELYYCAGRKSWYCKRKDEVKKKSKTHEWISFFKKK